MKRRTQASTLMITPLAMKHWTRKNPALSLETVKVVFLVPLRLHGTLATRPIPTDQGNPTLAFQTQSKSSLPLPLCPRQGVLFSLNQGVIYAHFILNASQTACQAQETKNNVPWEAIFSDKIDLKYLYIITDVSNNLQLAAFWGSIFCQ